MSKDMAQSDWERFKQLVFTDPALRDTLLATDGHDDFIALVLKLSREHGFSISADDVESAVNNGHRSWLERFI